MRRILVVAHKTLGGQHLLEEVGRRMKAGDCAVHLLVPINHPMGAFTEASCHAEAKKVLDGGLSSLRELDRTGRCEITGEVGDANPVYAAMVVRNRGERFDEVIVSTLPSGPSRWLRGGVPRKVAELFPDATTSHVVGAKEPART